jgi:hypothetical protein
MCEKLSVRTTNKRRRKQVVTVFSVHLWEVTKVVKQEEYVKQKNIKNAKQEKIPKNTKPTKNVKQEEAKKIREKKNKLENVK